MKGKKNFIITIIITIIIILLFIIISTNKENIDGFFNYEVDKEVVGKEIKYELENEFDKISQYDQAFIIWDKDKLISLDLKGEKKWEKEFNIDQPLAYLAENNIFVGEKTSGEVYILDKKGETLERINIDYEITNFKGVKDFLFIVVKEENLESLLIYNNNGSLKGRVYLGNVNTLTFDILEDGLKYCVSVLEVDDEGYKSIVSTYTIEGDFLYQREFQDEVIVLSEFIRDDRHIVATNKSLYSVNEGNILWNITIQGLKDIKVTDNIYLLEKGKFSIINFNGQIVNSIELDKDYNKIVNIDGSSLIFGQKEIKIFDNDEIKFQYKSLENIKDVFIKENQIYIFYKNELEVISIPYS